MSLFIMFSLHVGFIAVITGPSVSAYKSWRLRRWVRSVLSALHCTAWALAYVGLVVATFNGGNIL